MTEAEQFVHAQLGPQLREGEQIAHIGYLETASGSGIVGGLKKKGYWAALTADRLILVETRVGAFKALLENRGVQAFELGDLQGVHVGGTLSIALVGREPLAFEHRRRWKSVPGQQALLDALAARFGGTAAAARLGHVARWRAVAGAAVAVLVVGYVAYQQLYGGRAEVYVECRSAPSAVACQVQHREGGARAQACWDVVFHCKNGKQAKAHACETVSKGETREHAITQDRFAGLPECDALARSEVANLTVGAL